MELLVLFLSVACIWYFLSEISNENDPIWKGEVLSEERRSLAQRQYKSEEQQRRRIEERRRHDDWVQIDIQSNFFLD